MANDPRPTTRQEPPRTDQRGEVTDDRRMLDRDEELDGERNRVAADLGMDELLPMPPAIKGFHTIWLSTTNTVDSISRRQRAGYVLVKAEEIAQSSDYSTVKGGRFQGFVSCEEFILGKIPLAAYNRLRELLHHEKPLREEQGLRRQIDGIRASGTEGIHVGKVFGGTAGLGQDGRRPRFENMNS